MKLPFQVELGIAPRLRCWPASGFFAADDTEHAEPTIKALLGTMSPAFFAQSWLLGGAVPVSGYDVIISKRVLSPDKVPAQVPGEVPVWWFRRLQ